jgi:hypothetical protein
MGAQSSCCSYTIPGIYIWTTGTWHLQLSYRYSVVASKPYQAFTTWLQVLSCCNQTIPGIYNLATGTQLLHPNHTRHLQLGYRYSVVASKPYQAFTTWLQVLRCCIQSIPGIYKLTTGSQLLHPNHTRHLQLGYRFSVVASKPCQALTTWLQVLSCCI